MMADYEQMKMDFTLESERSLKDNIQKIVQFAYQQIMNEELPDPVRNKHEGYGIAAENFTKLQGAMKQANTDMGTFLKLLQSDGADVVSNVGSLYNSACEITMAAITLAAQANRIMKDLYYDRKTPIEEYLEDSEEQEDEFAEAGTLAEEGEEE